MCYQTCKGLIQLLRDLDFGEPISSCLALKHVLRSSSPHAQVEQPALYFHSSSALPHASKRAMCLFTRSSYLNWTLTALLNDISSRSSFKHCV